MNDRQHTVFQCLLRVQAFGQSHAADFPAGSKGAESLGIIDRSVTGLKLAGAQPGSGSSPATAEKEDLVDSLREDLKAIARTARAIEEAGGNAGFATPFRLPDDRSQRTLIAAARSVAKAFAEDASLAAKFIAYELPTDFVADLNADLAAYDLAVTGQADDRSEGVEDTAKVREHLRNGKDALFQLNTIALNKYRASPALLAAWKTAARIDRRNGGDTSTTPAPAAATPPSNP